MSWLAHEWTRVICAVLLALEPDREQTRLFVWIVWLWTRHSYMDISNISNSAKIVQDMQLNVAAFVKLAFKV